MPSTLTVTGMPGLVCGSGISMQELRRGLAMLSEGAPVGPTGVVSVTVVVHEVAPWAHRAPRRRAEVKAKARPVMPAF